MKALPKPAERWEPPDDLRPGESWEFLWVDCDHKSTRRPDGTWDITWVRRAIGYVRVAPARAPFVIGWTGNPWTVTFNDYRRGDFTLRGELR